MKKLTQKALVLLFVCVLVFSAFPKPASAASYDYRVIYNQGIAVGLNIMRCYGSGATTIPTTLGGRTVTGIDPGAFSSCSVTSVTIPSCVTSIAVDAFAGCSTLSSFTVDNANAAYASKDGVFFNKAKTDLIQYPVGNSSTSYTVPATVTSIEKSAFTHCRYLTDIGVDVANTSFSSQDGVLFNFTRTKLLQYPIANTRTSYSIPDGVTEIGYSPFSYCGNLEEIDIPSSVSTIGDIPFYYCVSLTSIDVDEENSSFTVQDGVLFSKNIKRLLFYLPGSTRTAYSIPVTVESIDNAAFLACVNLEQITVPSSVSSIGSYAFSLCSRLTGLVIPNGVTIISDSTFSGCAGLQSVSIPGSVVSIGQNAFSNCSNLSSITIPNGVTDVGNSTFNGCTGLTSVTLGSGMTKFGETSSTIYVNHYFDDIFPNCSALTQINVDSNNAEYSSLDGVLYNKNKTTLVRYPEAKTGSYSIPTGVTKIQSSAFSACKQLTIVNIPTSVNTIGSSAFSGCSRLFAACFIGNAPGSMGVNVFYLSAAGFRVYYVSGNTGFSSTWNGYYTATYNPAVSYTVAYAPNGGSGAGLETQTVYSGVHAYQPANPSRTGYAFGGWYQNESCSGTAWDFTTPVTASITLYAKWTINTYTVSFNSQGGSAADGTTANYGSTIAAPPEPVRTGYIFGGWYKEAQRTNAWNFDTDVVTGNMTLFAKWTIITYAVSFNSQGGSAVDGTTADYGATISAPPEPALTGHTFGGWYKEALCTNVWNFSSDVITDVTILYAKWTIINYTVSFNSQGGSDVDGTTANYGATIAAPPEPARTGYIFGGWYKEALCTNVWNFSSDVVTDVTILYAKWTIINYTVSFNSQGGSAVDGTAADYGSTIAAPPNPERTGYEFGGWYKEALCTDVWNFSSDVVTDVTILYAKWTINTYSVSFNSQGGSAVDGTTADYGSMIAAPPNPERTGYEFGSWYKEALCTNLWNFSSDVVTDVTILYAKWTINTYTVTFNTQGGGAVSPKTTQYNAKITAPTAPTRTGYAFGGWYKETGCTNAWNFGMDVVTGNITLFAKWTINTYTVTFNTQGGSAVSPKTAQYNAKITAPTAPTRTGYAFGGWYKETGCTNAWNFGMDVVTGNITLFAKWTINTYTVTFNPQGGGGVPPKTAQYNAKITAPTAPTRTGYAFGGWYKETGCTNAWNFGTDVVTGNVTLFAKWTINTYTVTFNTQGGSAVPPKTAQYNAKITAPTAPTRTGYAFGGWYKEAACKNAWSFSADRVTGNTTLYANWTPLAPSIPATPKAVSASYNSVKVSWAAVSNVTGYELFRASTATGTYTRILITPTLAYTNTGLTTGATYYYKVLAYRQFGAAVSYSGYSTVVSAKPIPAIPASVKATRLSSTSISITWGAVTGATMYEVWRSTSATGTLSLAGTATLTSFTNTGLTAGSTYYYKVRAYRLVGSTKVYSGNSVLVSATT